MKDLINKVMADAGLTEEQSRKAVESVSAYLRSKTPRFFHEQFDTLMNGGSMSEGVKKKFENLGKEVEDAARNLGDKAEDIARDVGKKITEVFGKK